MGLSPGQIMMKVPLLLSRAEHSLEWVIVKIAIVVDYYWEKIARYKLLCLSFSNWSRAQNCNHLKLIYDVKNTVLLKYYAVTL